MNVFKFGGASVAGPDSIQKAKEIVQGYKGEKLLIVVSAMGKTTNALEKVVEDFFEGRPDDALEKFGTIKRQHLDIASRLPGSRAGSTSARLLDVFTEVEWLLHDKPVRSFDYYYDQVVCSGELMSTCIISSFFADNGIGNTWVDVRDILRTDNNFRDAAVDWSFTKNKVESLLRPLFGETDIVVTQGFIGATEDNESTTLGREGSDYTAAVFANLLDSDMLTIWKDVEGIMNADPKLFPDAVNIRHLNYDEVIEMAYYGAQVIHPKTIKPLQNKNITLQVKCFLNKDLVGTTIDGKRLEPLPPIVVVKPGQALMHFHTRDFSFAGGKPVMQLYELLAEIHLQPNLVQTGAVKIHLCTDDKADKVEYLASSASKWFDVQVEKNLTLLTVRHYDEVTVQKLSGTKRVLLKQQTPETLQMLVSDT